MYSSTVISQLTEDMPGQRSWVGEEKLVIPGPADSEAQCSKL